MTAMNHREIREEIFDLASGKTMVHAAREAIETYLDKHTIVIPLELSRDPKFQFNRGCFVTLKTSDKTRSLRGCIGFSEPVYKLSRALTEAAIYAATEDHRFTPVGQKELDSLLLEVSILTEPNLIHFKETEEILRLIEIGRDGLIMRWSYGSGLLLPQVAIEQKWDAEEFLANLSMKAGAPPDQWRIPGTQILKFHAIVFSEETPKGLVRIEI